MQSCKNASAFFDPSRERTSIALARHSSPRQFTVEWADSPEDVREAQRLRYRVFAREMGARLSTPRGSPPGLDIDRFDSFCEHLLVRAGGQDGAQGEVIGTYRVLSPSQARRAGGYYSDAEFNLDPIASLRPRAVELGRSCVDADWRLGGVVMAMWTALGAYMIQHELDTMIGCASIGLAGGTQPAIALWQQLRRTHLAPAPWQVSPRCPVRIDQGSSACVIGLAPEMPPLIKGYLRCGARVLGPPSLDVAFNTVDLPMMLRLADMAPRYRNHFLRRADQSSSRS